MESDNKNVHFTKNCRFTEKYAIAETLYQNRYRKFKSFQVKSLPVARLNR